MKMLCYQLYVIIFTTINLELSINILICVHKYIVLLSAILIISVNIYHFTKKPAKKLSRQLNSEKVGLKQQEGFVVFTLSNVSQ